MCDGIVHTRTEAEMKVAAALSALCAWRAVRLAVPSCTVCSSSWLAARRPALREPSPDCTLALCFGEGPPLLFSL